jgi:hypothetical protein
MESTSPTAYPPLGDDLDQAVDVLVIGGGIAGRTLPAFWDGD